ncbi:MAG: MBL fold metallo-hydrolase [Deltaproteobacteria bacterium]|nr:MBL fold metallo-hydrolase [Deltaproteobacteria bacterium]
MKYEVLVVGPLETNCYILYSNQKECIVVDPGFEAEEIIAFIEKLGKIPKMTLLTHAHFDHISALRDLRDKFKSMKILIHPMEKEMLTQQSSFARFFGIKIKDPPSADGLIDEGDVISLGDERLEVIYTPGHSQGSISFISREDKFVVVGDLLFKGSIGRTDFPGGSFEEIKRSIQKKIYNLPDEFDVLPGHGDLTKVGIEKRYNSFVRGEAV